MTGLTKGVLSFGTAGILTAVFYLFDTGVIQPQRDEIRQMPAASPITTTQTRASNPGLSYPGLYNPDSLQTFRGATEVHGLRLKDGHLVIDRQLREWIDFHRAALGELTQEEITANLYAIAAALPAPADGEAAEIIALYLEYLKALNNYDEIAARQTDLTTLQQLTSRQDWLQRTRAYYFSDEVHEAFFGIDEALDQRMLSELTLKSKGAEEAEVEALEQTLPEELQAFRQRSHSVVRLAEEEQALKSRGEADSEHLWQLRASEFGEDAADRLADVDTRQQVWEGRIRDYMNFMASDTLHALPLLEQEARLEEYREAHFTEREIKRLPAAVAILSAR